MGRYKQYSGQIHTGMSSDLMERLDAIANITGAKRNEVVRKILDSALPSIDPKCKFWDICRNIGVFQMNIPANTIVPMITGLFDLEVTGKNQINGNDINLGPLSGLIPLLWALTNVKELLFNENEEA